MAADQAAETSGSTLPLGPIQWLCLGLLVSYLGLFAYSSLVRGQGVRLFHLIQSAAVLTIGFGGAARLSAAAGHGSQGLALFALAVALGGYLISFTVVRRRHGRGGEFFYFASLALVFLLLGTRAVLDDEVLIGAWLALGLLTAFLAGRYDRVTLRSHAVVYLLLASLQAGLLRAAADALVAGATVDWHRPGLMGSLTLLMTVAVAVLLNRQRGGQEAGRWRKWPRLLAIVLVLPGLAQLMVVGIVNLGGSAPPSADPRVVAAVRTGILALLAIGLALASRRPLLRDLRWLIYPVLGLGLLKVVLEDLRVGSPLGLFFAFATIGGALIIAPRLARTQDD